jgi:hypothetical protein
MDADDDDFSGGVCMVSVLVGDSVACVVEGRGVVAAADGDVMRPVLLVLLLLLRSGVAPRPGTATTLGASGADMAAEICKLTEMIGRF